MQITVAHSPDSDDAFMFYGLGSGKVPTDGIIVEHLLADIETLNRAAFDGRYEVTAVSFHAYALLTHRYLLLRHGASMGDRYGPIVVARTDGPDSLKDIRVAVPGLLTTAYLTLKLYAPEVEVEVMPFDRIQEAVKEGSAEAGLLIHEGQLTYQSEGLKKIVDLGEWWAEHTGGLPLPLGGNVIRKDLGPQNIAKISRMLRESIAYGLSHREEALDYARTNEGPVAVVIHTYRLCHHSKNDDNRPADEVAARWKLDPIEVHGRRLGASARAAIDAEVESALQDVIDRALAL